MLTGDNTAIAQEVAQRVGLGRTVVPAGALLGDDPQRQLTDADVAQIESVDGFAEVFPEHKYAGCVRKSVQKLFKEERAMVLKRYITITPQRRDQYHGYSQAYNRNTVAHITGDRRCRSHEGARQGGSAGIL